MKNFSTFGKTFGTFKLKTFGFKPSECLNSIPVVPLPISWRSAFEVMIKTIQFISGI